MHISTPVGYWLHLVAQFVGLARLCGVFYVFIVLSTGALRLAVVHTLAADRLHCPACRGILLPISAVLALFIIAVVTILLLFMGIRNAWDIVTYMSIERSKPQDKPGLAQTWHRLAAACSSAVGKCRVERFYTMILTYLELSATDRLRMSRSVV